ncbi:MAG: response regulator [Anaerolineae bacterium]|nr:response regulator [Anaerolineae bacterium]
MADGRARTEGTSQGRILVIDDEPEILMLVSRLLRRVGYQVETAESGDVALERLRAGPFSLVLSDLKMPHVDGMQVFEAVRTHYPDTEFILMTAFGTIDSAVSVLRRGAYDYLTKPLELDDLISTVERALEHRKIVMQNKRLMEFLQEKNVILEHLHQQERLRAEQLNQVNAIARQITPILDTRTLIDTVVRLVGPAFGFASFDFGTVTGQLLRFHGAWLAPEQGPVEESDFWLLTGGGRTRYVQWESEQEVGYDLVYPLRAGERVIGFWVADWGPGVAQREQSLPYLDALAAQTVTALENARLYALARRADELAFLNEVGRAANQSLDLEQTIQSVLASVRTTFDASLVEICLWGEDGAIEHAYSLVEGAYSQDLGSLLGAAFCQRVGREATLICPPVEAARIPGAAMVGVRSLLGVLLRFGDRPIGCMGVGSSAASAYDPEDVRLLEVVGAQVATAIQNARFFAEVESGRQTILESRNTLLALFDGILDGIYIVDRENKVLAVNRTQAARAGNDFRTLVGAAAEQAFPGGARALALIAETFRTGAPGEGAERQESQGRRTEWEIRTYPVWGAQAGAGARATGQVDRVVVVVRDVTAQRMMEAALARSDKLASVGRLAAGLAHEINNPMTVISTNAQILSEEVPATHPHFGSVRLIDRAAQRASRIVRNLLDFSRAEQFEFVEMDLNRSLEDAAALVAAEMRRANTIIALDLAPDLPAIWASPDHLQVVWLNMLLNARDAIEQAGREGLVRIASALDGERVVVHISDNGVGIPSQEVNRIYDPFFTTKPPGKGTGLGLFTCYQTIHRHAGEIRVQSKVGSGTTFEVSLPLLRDGEEAR